MKKLLLVLQMIKFEHTIFALPFAFLGAFLAADGFPGLQTSAWITLAMLGARSTAMAFNRLVDRMSDSLNPRTADRALPRGLVSLQFVCTFIAGSSMLFIFSAWMLNELAFQLSPVALVIIFFYSYTKRFTSLSHLFLGVSLAIAPIGGWIAVRGEVDVSAFYLAAAVVFWVGGFDIIYACQDVEFDRQQQLYSIPSRFGKRIALQISILFHILMMLVLTYSFLKFGLSILSWMGLSMVALLLIYEHRLVKTGQMTNAFFTVNGLISLILCIFVGLDLCLTT